MIEDYFKISFKNLKTRGLRSWLTLLGIVIGIAAVVSLISLGDGLKSAVNAQFGVSSTEVITVQAGGVNGYGPPGVGVVSPLTTKDTAAIEKLSSVEMAISRRIKTLNIEFNDKAQVGFAGDVPNGEKEKFMYDNLEISAEKGRMLQDGDTNKIVIGHDLSDSVKNGFEKEIYVGDSLKINEKDFRVVGILKKKGSFIVDKIILIKADAMKNAFNLNDDINIIAVKVRSKDLMEKAKTEIENLMRQRRNVKVGEEDFEVSTPEAMLSTVNSVLTGVQIFIILIASIAIIVGAIGISNTMLTSVMERTRDIGIMKAIGARNSDIFLQFFIEAGMLGLAGGIIGIIFGLTAGVFGILAINSFIGSEISLAPNIILITSVLIGSFAIGAVAGVLPAMKAAKQRPVEALRK